MSRFITIDLDEVEIEKDYLQNDWFYFTVTPIEGTEAFNTIKKAYEG